MGSWHTALFAKLTQNHQTSLLLHFLPPPSPYWLSHRYIAFRSRKKKLMILICFLNQELQPLVAFYLSIVVVVVFVVVVFVVVLTAEKGKLVIYPVECLLQVILFIHIFHLQTRRQAGCLAEKWSCKTNSWKDRTCLLQVHHPHLLCFLFNGYGELLDTRNGFVI